MSLHVGPGGIFLFWIAVWHFFLEIETKQLSMWLPACSVLIVVPLLLRRLFLPLVSWTEGFR